METGVRSLEFYEDYFNIKYPLPKCDMIAIPDFQAGAMENWGLVTYRSTCILFDADKVQYELKLAFFVINKPCVFCLFSEKFWVLILGVTSLKNTFLDFDEN